MGNALDALLVAHMATDGADGKNAYSKLSHVSTVAAEGVSFEARVDDSACLVPMIGKRVAFGDAGYPIVGGIDVYGVVSLVFAVGDTDAGLMLASPAAELPIGTVILPASPAKNAFGVTNQATTLVAEGTNFWIHVDSGLWAAPMIGNRVAFGDAGFPEVYIATATAIMVHFNVGDTDTGLMTHAPGYSVPIGTVISPIGLQGPPGSVEAASYLTIGSITISSGSGEPPTEPAGGGGPGSIYINVSGPNPVVWMYGSYLAGWAYLDETAWIWPV
jgi:hypothetical protein